jgi:hypothetical protein
VKTRRSVSVAALMAVLALAFGAMVGFGSRGVVAQEEDTPHPAHIHSGTCATLGDVVYPLSNVGGPMTNASGTPEASMQMGATDAIPVETSVTTVQTTLSELTGTAYAINVHESADNIGTYIACGDIGGAVMGSDLAIGLGELNGSGYSGVAWLHDNGDGTTTVTVFLTEEYGAETGTPAAS